MLVYNVRAIVSIGSDSGGRRRAWGCNNNKCVEAVTYVTLVFFSFFIYLFYFSILGLWVGPFNHGANTDHEIEPIISAVRA